MTATETSQSTISVYLLAAPEDQVVAEAIQEHLAPVVKYSETPITVSSDFDIEIGADRDQQKQRLLSSDIVLALISADFINDDEVYERNQHVIARHNRGETVMIPILVRNCLWKLTPFGKDPLRPKLLPKNVQPLNNADFWNSPDDALTAVVTDIYDSVSDLSGRRPAPVQPVQVLPTAPAPAPPPTEAPADRSADVPQPTAPASWQPPAAFAPPEVEPAPPSGTSAGWAAPAQAVEVNWRDRYYRRVLWKRGVALVLDFVIVFFLPLIVGGFILGAVGSESTSAEDATVNISIAVSAVLFYVVNPLFEASSWKATVGKRILKIEITDRDGQRVSFWRAFVRNVLRTLVLYSFFFVIPLILQIISFQRNKRLFHDRWSGTVIGERL